jgi:hypothetical protein
VTGKTHQIRPCFTIALFFSDETSPRPSAPGGAALKNHSFLISLLKSRLIQLKKEQNATEKIMSEKDKVFYETQQKLEASHVNLIRGVWQGVVTDSLKYC